MKKSRLILMSFMMTVVVVSCEKDNQDTTLGDAIEKKVASKPKKPGTYHYKKMVNGYYQGCDEGKGVCVLYVTEYGTTVPNLEPLIKDVSLQKDIYLKTKIPAIFKNLNTNEIAEFKEIMVLNEDKALISYDMDLLKKGTLKEFDAVITSITKDLGGDTSRIILVSPSGEEQIIYN